MPGEKDVRIFIKQNQGWAWNLIKEAKLFGGWNSVSRRSKFSSYFPKKLCIPHLFVLTRRSYVQSNLFFYPSLRVIGERCDSVWRKVISTESCTSLFLDESSASEILNEWCSFVCRGACRERLIQAPICAGTNERKAIAITCPLDLHSSNYKLWIFPRVWPECFIYLLF